MIYLADTADINEIRELFKYLPIEGVTTNPTIVKNAGLPISKVIPEIQKCIGDKMMHFQVVARNADDILKEAILYRDYFDFKEKYYVKVPVTYEGYRAISMVKDAGMNVTATAIFTQQQAFLAANAGADFVAPYVNRLDNISSHGIDVVADIVKGFILNKIKTKVLAASFKNVDQIYRVSMVGCHSVTVPYDLLMATAYHPMTDKGVIDFETDAIGYYDIKP